MLTEDDILIIAIENQFGLKYFNGDREDHLGTLFDGNEGCSRHPGKARTFGRDELDLLVKEKFEHTRFLYPYPDYKIPDCVLSEEFLKSGHAAEIISQIPSRDYCRPMRSFWNETFASRSEEHTSELQSLMRISYAVFCLKKKNKKQHKKRINQTHEKHDTKNST